jgi:hypothetical protein
MLSSKSFLITTAILFFTSLSFSQECKVLTPSLSEKYEGECKKGVANGKGEAWGQKLHYKGDFKKGAATGKGSLFFEADSTYTGVVQDGLREGKGEMLYKVTNGGTVKDSIVKGYWSADVYRGNSYTTYKVNSSASFASYEISPSLGTGDVLTFEVSSTSGIPANGSGVYVTSLLVKCKDGEGWGKFISTYNTTNTSFTTVQITCFPAVIQGRLTNGNTFEIELYKAADWKIKFFINK